MHPLLVAAVRVLLSRVSRSDGRTGCRGDRTDSALGLRQLVLVIAMISSSSMPRGVLIVTTSPACAFKSAVAIGEITRRPCGGIEYRRRRRCSRSLRRRIPSPPEGVKVAYAFSLQT